MYFYGKPTLGKASKKQSNVFEKKLEFVNTARPKSKADKQGKEYAFESINALCQNWELFLNDLNSKVPPLEPAQGKVQPKWFKNYQ